MSSENCEKQLKHKKFSYSHLWRLKISFSLSNINDICYTYLDRSVVKPRFTFVHVKKGKKMAVSICTLLLAFLANVYSNSSGQNSAAPFCGTYNYGIFVEGGTRRF